MFQELFAKLARGGALLERFVDGFHAPHGHGVSVEEVERRGLSVLHCGVVVGGGERRAEFDRRIDRECAAQKQHGKEREPADHAAEANSALPTDEREEHGAGKCDRGDLDHRAGTEPEGRVAAVEVDEHPDRPEEAEERDGRGDEHGATESRMACVGGSGHGGECIGEVRA
ncbi:MAG: hypothetical protein QM783_19350 [Phycisphaerales bacterium]